MGHMHLHFIPAVPLGPSHRLVLWLGRWCDPPLKYCRSTSLQSLLMDFLVFMFSFISRPAHEKSLANML